MNSEDIGSRGPREVTFVEPLGKGGFGAVYLANVRGQDNFVQRIAVKVLNEDLGENEDLVARQRDEARILAQLNHDHIVKVFDLSEIHGRPAIFMEYVAGIDAGRLLQAGPVPARAALEIAAAVASALDAAWTTLSPLTGHALHVVHRDIKPSNILVSERGGVKVLDFGIARAEMEREGQTKSHQFGTARYMAPEQWLGGVVGPAVDIYGLGITMLELLSGVWMERLPIMEDRFDRLRDSAIESIRDPRWGAMWWRDLSGLLQRMLSMEPAGRPSAREVESMLLDLSEQVGGESLGRLARRSVPNLMKQRRSRTGPTKLVSTTDTWHQTNPDPSILTGSKQVLTVPDTGRRRTGRLSHRLQWLSLAVGLSVAAAWMIWAWVGVPSNFGPGPATAPGAVTSRAAGGASQVAADGGAYSAVQRVVLRLDSNPQGAVVLLDGKRIGETPLLDVEVGLGKHRIRMQKGKQRGSRRIEVRAGAPTHYTWDLKRNRWSSGF